MADCELLLQRANEAPTEPGVYLMKDAQGAILYIGKAKHLKNRVTTYFQGGGRHEDMPRIRLLVNKITDFEVIITETESEALILENTLIKKHKPPFNVRLKDDKTYPYLKVPSDAAYPRIEWTRRVKRDGARYFGPFPSAWAAKQVLKLLNMTFKLRDCSDNTFRHRTRPCILYQMEQCSAPCVGHRSEKEYAEDMGEAVAVLEGKGSELVEQLERGMRDAAEREEYEVAAEYRDQLQYLKQVTETQTVMEAGADRDRDVLGLAVKGEEGSTRAQGVVLQIRQGKLLAVRHYHLENVDGDVGEEELVYDMLTQHYLGRKETDTVTLPQEVLVPISPHAEDVEAIASAIGVQVLVRDNENDDQLLKVAATNAKHSLETDRRRAGGHGMAALEEVQRKLGLERLPSRIECYDISNIHGEDAVASRVVFVDGAPNKNLYRRYKIKTVEGSDDFAMMKEVLDRRFSRGEEAMPELVVVDGGKGQLSQAVAILEELNIQGVAVAGLAKARTKRDFKSKEVEATQERVFIPGRKNPVALYPTTKAFRLLVHVRDEAHRFAVSYHRKVRDKARIPSK